MECVSLVDIDEAASCAEMDNVGGIIGMYVAFHGDVATFPAYPTPEGDGTQSATPMTYDEAGKWKGSFVMKEGKKFAHISFTDEGAELTFAESGDNGNMKVQHTLNVRRNKLDSVIAGFMNSLRNRRLVIVCEDANGNKYILGDKRIPCMMGAGDNSTTGKLRNDLNQANMQFNYTAPRLLIYDGDIPTA